MSKDDDDELCVFLTIAAEGEPRKGAGRRGFAEGAPVAASVRAGRGALDHQPGDPHQREDH